MKTLNGGVLKSLFYLLFVAIFLTACAQSNHDTADKPGVEKPDIDINAAVMANNLEAIKDHIEAGTDINLKDPLTGSTPLISAVTFEKTEIAKTLIDGGADLTVKNNDGATPLHAAAFFGRVELVQMLIDANADKTLRNNFGATPRESIMGPFADIKPIYEMLLQQLGVYGLELDMEELEKARPIIAEMLK